MKRLSNLMLLSNLICTIFYSMSYPYIYAETIKVVPHLYIGLEQIFACIGTIIICRLWNLLSDRLFHYYKIFLWCEIVADAILFIDVIIRQNLSFYFLLNIIIYSIITRNISCASTKMRAIVNPTEHERETYDNNANIINAVATLTGTGIAMALHIDLQTLFILAFFGNVIDNIFYFYIYQQIVE